MRALLVNPFYPISETPSPPLGLAVLAGVLERAGIEVMALDFVVYPYSKEKLGSALKDFSPDLVGTTAVTMNVYHALQVIRDVKGIDPDILTVMGGPHVTFCPEETMRECPELDFVVLGEGEASLVELSRQVDGDRRWGDVPGIVFRRGPDLISTPSPHSPVDLSALPFPARNLFPLGRYRALGMPVSMITSRGCPFHCIFCVGRRMGGGNAVRYRPPLKVVDELEYLAGLGFHQVNIADDLFTAHKGHCLAVCEEILRRNLRVKWTCFARVDTVTRDMLKKMREAGCSVISFGVESANREILKTIRKGITVDQAVGAVRLCVEEGLTPQVSFILGLPGETPETLKETVGLGERLQNMGALYGFHLLAPYPGTQIRTDSERLGIRILTDDWSLYHANRAIVETTGAPRDMLDDIAIHWENKFLEALGDLKMRWERGEATEEEAWPWIRLEHTVLIYELMMGRLIEKKGIFHGESASLSVGEERIEGLIGRLKGEIPYTEEQILNTLRFSWERGNLGSTRENGGIRWGWVDYL